MNTIILDLDDVICDMSTPLSKALKVDTGKHIEPKDWSTFNLAEIYEVASETIFETLNRHEIIKHVKPVEHAKESIKLFRELEFKVHIVTSRKPLDPSGEITQNWLDENQIAVDELSITCHSAGKSEVAKKVRPLYFVDDHGGNLIDCAPYCTKSALLIDKPWNQKYAFNRLASLEELVRLLDIGT